MLLYCLKCRKNTKCKNSKGARTKKWFHQNVQCVIVNNQNLSNSKKLVDY